MMYSSQRIVVFGAGGYMAVPYIRALKELGVPSEHILGVEPDPDRRKLAEGLGIRVYADPEACRAERLSMAIVAAPAETHRRIFDACADLGIRNVLSEKPLVLQSSELDGLGGLGLRMYVGYLVNFSPVVTRLRGFIAERNLRVCEVHGIWGSNWVAKQRPIGPDLQEELPHPLVAALHIIGFDRLEGEGLRGSIRRSFVQHVHPDAVREAKASYNDSSTGMILARTAEGDVPIHLISSFNFFEQRRVIDVSLAENGSQVPTHKACLEFDVDHRFDRLRIIDARTNAPIPEHQYEPMASNKLLDQLRAVLEAFSGIAADERLIGFEVGSALVRLLEDVADD